MPTSLPIGGIDWTVKYHARVVDDDDSEVSGLTDGSKFTITISWSENASRTEAEFTLLHEVGHAILYMSGLTEALDGKLEEAIVCAWEKMLFPLYQRRSVKWTR